MASSRDQMMSPRLLQSSNRRVCGQVDRKASLLPVSLAQPQGVGNVEGRSPSGLEAFDVCPDNLAESRVRVWAQAVRRANGAVGWRPLRRTAKVIAGEDRFISNVSKENGARTRTFEDSAASMQVSSTSVASSP